MKVYGLTIDHDSCWGCRACEVACKQENRASYNLKLISVLENRPAVADSEPEFSFFVNVCRHCETPDCADACPENAIVKREDGLVVLDDELCSGCGICVEACPYDAIAFDTGKNKAMKCNLCHHRVKSRLLPACADNICLAHCIHFTISEK